MEIRTARLLLRTYQSEDWKAIHTYHSNADILRFESWGPHTPSETRAFVQAAIADGNSKNPLRHEFLICTLEDQKIIGGCGLRLHEHKKGYATLGYILNPNYWRKGYASEAAIAMVQFARELHQIHTLFAICDRENHASQRVLQRCGLEAVGMVAELEMVKDRYRDMIQYELIL